MLQNRLNVKLSSPGLNLTAENFIVSSGSVSGAVIDYGDGNYSVGYVPDGMGDVVVEIIKDGVKIMPVSRTSTCHFELTADASLDSNFMPTKISVALSEAVDLAIGNFTIKDPENTHVRVSSVMKVSDTQYDLNLEGITKSGAIVLNIVKTNYLFDGAPFDFFLNIEVVLENAWIQTGDATCLRLQFSGDVATEEGAGIAVNYKGIACPYYDQPDSKTLRFKLVSGVFLQGDTVSASYDGMGGITNPLGAHVSAFTNVDVSNNSDAVIPVLIGAHVDTFLPDALTLDFNCNITVQNDSAITLLGTSITITGILEEDLTEAVFQLSRAVTYQDAAFFMTMAEGCVVSKKYGLPNAAVSNYPVANNVEKSNITATEAVIYEDEVWDVYVYCQDTVRINGAVYGITVPPGWSVTSDFGGLDFTGGWEIQGVFVKMNLNRFVYAGENIVIKYDGSDPTFVDAISGKPVLAFELAVQNYSGQGFERQEGYVRDEMIMEVDLRKICHTNDILMIMEEIQHGYTQVPLWGSLYVGMYLDLPHLNDQTEDIQGNTVTKNLRIRIAGSGLDNQGVSFIMFEFQNIPTLAGSRTMMRSGGNSDNWGGYPYEGTDHQTAVLKPYLENSFSSGLMDVLGIESFYLKERNLIVGSYSGGWHKELYSAAVFPLTRREVFGDTGVESDAYEDAQLAIYQAGASPKKSFNGTLENWWLATPTISLSNAFSFVEYDGTIHTLGDTKSVLGASPAFCLRYTPYE